MALFVTSSLSQLLSFFGSFIRCHKTNQFIVNVKTIRLAKSALQTVLESALISDTPLQQSQPHQRRNDGR